MWATSANCGWTRPTGDAGCCPQAFASSTICTRPGCSDHPATGYITTIIEGNAEAEGLLVEKARRHYPAYRRVDRLFTLAIILGKRIGRGNRLATGDWELRPADTVDPADLLACLHREGPSPPLFPGVDARRT